MITFLMFLEVAMCYTIAGAVCHTQVDDMTALKKPRNFNWVDALFLAFAPITVPGAYAYLLWVYFTNKDYFND